MPSNFNDLSGDVWNRMQAAAERAITRTAIAIDKQYKSNLRSTLNTTGTAQGSLLSKASYDVQKAGLGSRARVGNGIVYARIHEFGGTITPKTAPHLVFQTADGEWHTVDSVVIPARPTLRPAMLDHLDEPKRIFAEELSRA